MIVHLDNILPEDERRLPKADACGCPQNVSYLGILTEFLKIKFEIMFDFNYHYSNDEFIQFQFNFQRPKCCLANYKKDNNLPRFASNVP